MKKFGNQSIWHCIDDSVVSSFRILKWQGFWKACWSVTTYTNGDWWIFGLLQRSSLLLGLWVGSHLALTNFHLDDPSELSHGFAVNDSTINIVLVVLLL